MKSFFVFITTCLFYSSVRLFGENKVNLSESNDLMFEKKYYKYSSTFSVGGLFSITRGLFTDLSQNDGDIPIGEALNPRNSLSDLSNIVNKIVFSMGLNFSYNVLFSSAFFAKNLGVFPRFGLRAELIGQNLITRFLIYLVPNIGIFFINGGLRVFDFLLKVSNKLCSCCISDPMTIRDDNGNLETRKYYNTFLSTPSGILNIPFTFEPEIGMFENFKVIPQIGIGPSLVFLARNCITDYFPDDPENFVKSNDKLLYPQVFDVVFSFKMLFKFTCPKNYLNAFQLELGYTYNPLFLSYFMNSDDANVQGGLWNLTLTLNYSRNMNIGLETSDFLNPIPDTTLDVSGDVTNPINKDKKTRTTTFLDAGLGLGQWIDIGSNGDIKKNLSPNINFSLTLPYFFKLSKYHYLGFIGVDVNEDMYTGAYHNNDHNFLWCLVNNMSVNYNFLVLTSDYNGVKFVHKLGMYLPFLTGLMSYLEKPSKSEAFNRGMVSFQDPNIYSQDNSSWGTFFYSKLCYKFKFYLDIFRLANIDFKFNTYFYFGLNTVLFNRRTDCARFSSTNGYDLDIIKVESFVVGISFKLN